MKKLLLSIITASGMLFSTQQANAQNQVLIPLTTFGGSTLGQYAQGSLITDGTYLYGTTTYGGTQGTGLIYKIKPDGTGYDTLLSFNSTNGSNPTGTLLLWGTTLYGMTSFGGTNNHGLIFKIETNGTGFDTLLNFDNINGANPNGALISDGTYLYGMTTGDYNTTFGNVFKIKPNGTGFVDLYDFTNYESPTGDLYWDGTYLYGMTPNGGASNMGNIFKINPDGSNFTELYAFSNNDYPNGSLTSDGTYLYGMGSNGGANQSGDIFKINPDGSNFTDLYDFGNNENPKGSLITDGTYLYGMSYGGGNNGYGNVFKIKPDGSNYIDLADFDGQTTGGYPLSGALLMMGGNLFGTTAYQGPSGAGSVFGVYPQAAALNFDGVDDYIDVDYFNMPSYTKEAWVNFTGNTGSSYNIISSDNSPFWISGGYLTASNDFTGSQTIITDPALFPTNVWTHVAVTYDSLSSTMTLYKNGIQVAQSTSIIANNNQEDVQIGAYLTASNFQGNMDEVRVWNYARTSCQINSTMSCELDSADKANYNLYFYYQFNEGGVGANNAINYIANDSSLDGENGTLYNFALNGTTSTWVAPGAVTSGVSCQPLIAVNNNSQVILPGATATLTATGTATTFTWSTMATTASIAVTPSVTTIYTVSATGGSGCMETATATVTVASPGAALDFNYGASVNVGNSLTTIIGNQNSITAEAWVKPANTPSYGVIFGNYSNPANEMQFLLRQENDAYSFWVDLGAGFQEVITPAATATVGVWQHVTGVWDGNNLMIYVNGVLQATNTTNVSGPHLNTATTNSVVIGTDGVSEQYTGSIDEVRLWGRALCLAEIQNNMNAELNQSRANLLAYYKFNQGWANDTNNSVITLVDSSGNGYNGTLTNFNLYGATSNWTAPGAVTIGNIAPALISVIATQTNVTCNGLANGTASVTVTSIATPITYTWSVGASTTNLATGLMAGNYTCTINYACGTTTQAFTITEPGAVDISVANVGNVITATDASATYQWVDCANGKAAISGATNQSYTATPGSYAVVVTEGACSDTSTCTIISTTGIAKNNSTSNISVYPNPFNNELTIVSSAKTNAILFDILGNNINEFVLQNTTQTISLGNLAPGVYYLQIDAQKIKIIKQ